jgi:Rrf2 family protein
MGAKVLSEQSCVTLRFSLKILRKLVANGIVRSFKGTQGGYEIARPPEEINLHDILETIEGPFIFNRCLYDDFECTRCEDKNCSYYDVFAEISAEVRDRLKAVTIAEVIRMDEEPDIRIVGA